MEMSDIGDRLKRIIEESGLTQRELGVKAGVHEVSISRIIHDSRKPSVLILSRLAEALGVSVADLIEVRRPQVSVPPGEEEAHYEEAERELLMAAARAAERATTPRLRSRWERAAGAVARMAAAGGGSRFSKLSAA